jgi:hypothetical protein
MPRDIDLKATVFIHMEVDMVDGLMGMALSLMENGLKLLPLIRQYLADIINEMILRLLF